MVAFGVLVLHLLGASVWVGGHLVLLLTVLPRAVRERDPEVLLRFERPYERIGIPALIVQLITGLWLAHRLVPGVLPAFALADPLQRLVALKLLLLLGTAVTGAHARLCILPRITPERLPRIAWHVGLVTAMAIALLVSGTILGRVEILLAAP